MKRLHTAWFLAVLLLVAATGSVAVATTTHRATRHTVPAARPRGASRHSTPTTVARTTSSPRTATTSTNAEPVNIPSTMNLSSLAANAVPCVGVPMLSGQADIDAKPQGTTFCLSGTHNWTLTPKSNDTIRGTGNAVLDGNHWSTTSAVVAAPGVSGVVLWNIEIRNYATQGDAFGAITVPDPPNSVHWFLINLYVHDNGKSFGGNWLGAGAELGTGWVVVGGRYSYNRQEGLTAGGGASNDIVTAYGPLVPELDHNGFQADHVTSGGECGHEAGGFKWVADGIRVQYTNVHDNACMGLWADINSTGGVITNNTVTNNWNSGIFWEVSMGVSITYNVVRGNGFKTFDNSPPGCNPGWGGGISISDSGRTGSGNANIDIDHNIVSGNCNGITGLDNGASGGSCGAECNVANVHLWNNAVIACTGRSADCTPAEAALANNNFGNFEWDGDGDARSSNNTFANNTIGPGINFCGNAC
jgi:parallel beta-helix repeat protein